MKLHVPLITPYSFEILFTISESCNTFIIGMPPATAASYRKKTLFFLASSSNIDPSFARSDLLAVTTCFPLLIASFITFLAVLSISPISSTITCTSGSFAIFIGEAIHLYGLISTLLFFLLFLAFIATNSSSIPVLFFILLFCLFNSFMTPEPTVPRPIIATFNLDLFIANLSAQSYSCRVFYRLK